MRGLAEGGGRTPTTRVGSLPRPQAVADLLVAEDRGEPTERAEYEATLGAAVAGVDLVSDGEMGEISYATSVRHRA